MSFLGKGRKCDLIELATEIGESVPSGAIIIDIKNIITSSKNYEEVFVKQVFERIIEERVKKEESEREKLDREKQRQLEIEERDKERKFELEKLKLQNKTSERENGSIVVASEVNKKSIDLKSLVQKFDSKEGDISTFLILFERQAKQVGLKEEDFVFHLLGLLPLEISQLIARESEEEASEYTFVKKLLLRRFKLSPEKFRQRFVNHVRDSKNTWADFVFEIRNYFNEWLAGLKVDDFESLKELIITDQLKKRVPNFIREHLVDSWSKFVNASELAGKLDEYESVRSGIKINSENKNTKFVSQCDDFKNYSRTNFRNPGRFEPNKFENRNPSYKCNERESAPKYNDTHKLSNSSTRNEKGEPKCFSCNLYGHISKDCPYPCSTCGLKGHTKKYCTKNKREVNLSVNVSSSISAEKYLRDAKIKNRIVSCLLDTGSSSCLLKEGAAKMLGLNVTPCEKDLYSFGYQRSPAMRSIGAVVVDFQIDDVMGKDISVLIVPDSAQPVDLIVGRTFLDLPYIAYAKVGENLHVGYAKNYPFIELDCIEETQSIKLKADESTQIINNSVNFVMAKTEQVDNGLIMIEGKEGHFDSLLEIKGGKTIVPIVNIGSKEITLKENQNVGRAKLVEEVNSEPDLNYLKSVNENKSVEILNISETELKRKPITLDQIKFDKKLTEKQQLDILNLINEFRDCFALDISELGCTNITKMEINEMQGSKPVNARPYKTNATEREIIKGIVKEWKDYGIVSETRSPYASPVLLVRKKTGEHRLVVDYRRLNNQTVKDKYPLPKIDNLLECLSGVQFFTTLDLAHGYLQIPLSEDAKQKTAFITPDETGQFNRMIFGLANAPSEFQRLMHQVLGPLFLTKALCYLDDILIPAKSWEGMIERLREVLERLREAKLTLKLSKCEFGKKEVNFLGFVLNRAGLKPGPRKVRSIEEFPEPKNVHDIRRFLGLTGFFRRFIHNYAQKAEPLSRLTRQNEEFVWREEQEVAYNTLKKELCRHPTLAHYNPEAKTEVHTDASAEGLSGMIIQQEGSEWHLVYCVSKKTSEVEKKYHSSKLELMAIVWTLDRLRQFLLGIEFTIVTDCQSLVYMNSKKTRNPQIARWFDLIQEFDFTVQHRPGKKMSHVDALSRAPVLEAEDTLTNIIEKNIEVCLTLTGDEQVLVIQHSDPELKELIGIFQKNEQERSKEESQRISNYVFKRNRLFRITNEKGKEKLLYVIPKSMRKGTVVKFHDLMGHFSVDKTVSKIKELYWFPAMKRYVRKHISMCFECLINKVPAGKQQGKLHPINPGKRPFAIIHMDHLGPFVKSSKGNKELFVIIDNFTRFTRLYPMKSTSTKDVMIALKSFVDDFGLPERIISDRGTCFTAKEFEEFCRSNGIKHTLNSTQHPQGNGMVERANRTILSTIKTNIEKPTHRDWDKKIKESERNLNSMVNKTTGKTPFELLHGYSPRYVDGLMRMLADEDTNEWTSPSILQTEARKTIEDKQKIIKAKYDERRSKSLTFEVGEVVVMKRVPKSTGDSTKTQPKYRGPLIITAILPSDTYRVTQLEEQSRGQFYTTTAHVSQLKSWCCQAESDEESDPCDDYFQSPSNDSPNCSGNSV